MTKYIKLLGIMLLFVAALFSLSFADDDSYTITTYYPSPYGSYNELTTAGNTYLATSSGNVGIGKTNPGGKLDVAGGYSALDNGDFAAVRGLRFRNTTDTTTPTGGGLAQANNNVVYLSAGSANQIIFRESGGATDSIQFNNLAAANPTINVAGTDRLDITANSATLSIGGTSGNVGIGTTGPYNKLDIAGNLGMRDNDIYLRGTTGVDTNHGLGFYGVPKSWGASDNVNGPVLYGYEGGRLGTNQFGTKVTALAWNSSGNVGIGTTAPGTRLAVSGLTGTTSYNYVRVNTATGDFYYDTSSQRNKENIKPLKKNFSKILNVQAKSYKDKASGEQEIGYVAEELDKMGLKDLVIYDKGGQPNGIKYDRMVIYLLEIVKQQERQIQELKGQ